MVERINAYKTYDGQVFETIEEADEHELEMTISDIVSTLAAHTGITTTRGFVLALFEEEMSGNAKKLIDALNQRHRFGYVSPEDNDQ